MTQRFQVTVIGGGLVGTSTALALAKAGLSVALIEPRLPEPPGEEGDTRARNNDARWDTRIYAISPGSEAFLTKIGAWQQLDSDRVQPVYRMDVSGDAGGELLMDAYESGVPRLASILESGRLQEALWQALKEQGAATVICPATVSQVAWGDRYSRITLDNGQIIEAELIVGAEGRASPIRSMAGIEARVAAYDQSGVVANFAVERPHRGTAYQRFRQGDVVAYLPLPGNRMSLVWSTSTEQAQQLVKLPASEFCQQVMAAGNRQLGQLELLTPAAAFPLSLMQVANPVRPGCALVGDAAHGVHPLAGQGVNLGFGDAESLAKTLSSRGAASCGDVMLLQRYARHRTEPVARMQAVTDGLLRLFRMNQALPSSARNLGMNVLNRIGPLKSALIHEAFFN